MGGGSYSSSAYNDAVKTRRTTGTPDFKHDADIKAGKAAAAAAPELDPSKMVAGAGSALAGQIVRESRDIDGKESYPIIVIFDETGSMGSMPIEFQKDLTKLMEVLKDKGKIAHPQICFGCVGDTRSDKAPFQVSQFEADNRCDEWLRKFYIEQNGGGQSPPTESYGLAYYFAANRTATDAWDKRGEKGLLITIGDEGFDPVIRKRVDMTGALIFGVDEPNEDATEVIAKAMERWECFHLRILQGGGGRDPHGERQWREVLGERCIMVDDFHSVVERIAAIALMVKGGLDVKSAVAATGLSGAAAKKLENELAVVGSGSLPAQIAKGGVPTGHGGKSSGIDRI